MSSIAETYSESITVVMFNLERLNVAKPEVIQGHAWERGMIPKSLIPSSKPSSNGWIKVDFILKLGLPSLIRPQTRAVEVGISHKNLKSSLEKAYSGPHPLAQDPCLGNFQRVDLVG